MDDTLISFYYPKRIETVPCHYVQTTNAVTLQATVLTAVNCRAMLLRALPFQVVRMVTAPALRPEYVEKIRLIALEFGVHVDLEQEIQVVGGWDAVHSAFVRICVMLDELAGWTCGTFEVDVRYAVIVGGIEQQDIKQIMVDTCTQIYSPNPYKVKQSEPFYITGDAPNVQDAIKRLQQLMSFKALGIIQKTATSLPKKLDWMVSTKKEEMYQIMMENGVFINIPSLGSSSNLVTFLGTEDSSIDRAMRLFFLITSQMCVSCIQLKSKVDIILEDLCKITGTTRAEVVIQKQFIEIYGLESQVKKAYTLLTRLPAVKPQIKDTKFQIECALEHKDFVQGKKAGKITKITKQTDAKITIHDMDSNMLIDIYHPQPDKELISVALMQDELPAEISFCVPEVHHKKIIGVGGKNIQVFMKKHGVYVKFASQAEFAATGGYYTLMDNVIARTPTKNQAALHELRADILGLLDRKDNEEAKVKQLFPVQRELVPYVMGFLPLRVDEIADMYKCKITMATSNAGQDGIWVRGFPLQVEKALQALVALVPTRQSLPITTKPSLIDTIQSDSFHKVTAALYREQQITLSITSPTATETLFTFTTYTPHLLPAAIQKILFLISPKQNPFASKLFSSFSVSLSDSKSVPDLRHVFDAPITIPKHAGASREMIEDSPNRDTLDFLSSTLAGARLSDEWVEDGETAEIGRRRGSAGLTKTPTSIFRGLAMSHSVPSLNSEN